MEALKGTKRASNWIKQWKFPTVGVKAQIPPQKCCVKLYCALVHTVMVQPMSVALQPRLLTKYNVFLFAGWGKEQHEAFTLKNWGFF